MPYSPYNYAPRRAAVPSARRGRNEWTLIAIVFVGAAIGSFILWPILRPLIIRDNASSSYSASAGFDRQDGRPHARGRR